MDVVLITEQNMKWFEPILPEEERRLLKYDSSVFALGGVVEETACSVLVCRHNELSIEIIYLVVSDSYRRRKVATNLVGYLCGMVKEKEMPVSCYFSEENEKDSIYAFFDSLESFSITDEEQFNTLMIPYTMLKECPVLNRLKTSGEEIKKFFELPAREQKILQQNLLQEGIYFLEGLEQEKDKYLPDLCLVHTAERKILAALFMEKVEDSEDILLSLAYSAQNGSKYMLEEFQAARKYVMQNMGQNGNVRIDTVHETAFKLLKKLYPDSQKVDTTMYVANWDRISELGGI